MSHERELHIRPIRALRDNYVWLLQRGEDARCAVVDPGQHAPVLEVLERDDLELTAILLTHHHPDHVGGVPGLLERVDVPVHGPDDERLPVEWQRHGDGDRVRLDALDLEFEVLDIPAHTRSHIAFHGHGLVFSGDTLFSVGCGRLFEGTPADMQAALDRLAGLPRDTRVYCGHEYTDANCRFALQVEPDNAALQRRAEQARRLTAEGRVTLPSTIAEELEVNPFLRSREPTVVAAARVRAPNREPDAAPGAGVLGVIRAWKDRS